MPPHKNQGHFDPQIKTKYFSTPTQNVVHSDPYTEVKSISIPIIQSSQFWCRDTKTKLISIPTLKPSVVRPPH